MESMLLNNNNTLLLGRVNTLTRKSKSQMLVWQMMRNDERGGWQGLLAMKRGEMGGRLHAVGCDDGAALRLVLKKPSNHTHHPPSLALLLLKETSPVLLQHSPPSQTHLPYCQTLDKARKPQTSTTKWPPTDTMPKM